MKSFWAKSLFPALLVASLAWAAPIAGAAEWQGTVTTEDGVKHVQNSQPMDEPMTVELQEAWRLGGSEDAEEFFGVIGQVLVDDEGQVYILDSQLNEIQVYAADGSYVNTIGREGEAPGEFRNAAGMFFLGDDIGVIQSFPGRIVVLSKDGEPQDDLPVPAGDGGMPSGLVGGGSLGDNIAIAGFEQSFADGNYKQTRFLAVLNTTGEEVSRLYSEDRPFDMQNPVIDEKVWDTFDRRWHTSPSGDRVLACVDRDPYKVTVWNAEGEKSMVIEREYTPRRRTSEDKDRIKAIYEGFTRQVPGTPEIKIYDEDKDINTIYSRPDGSLWVLTSKGSQDLPDGVVGVFDVFNKEGKYVRQVTLKGHGNPMSDGYIFAGDRFFVLTGFLEAAMAAQGGGSAETEDAGEAAPMGIICYKLDVPNMGT